MVGSNLEEFFISSDLPDMKSATMKFTTKAFTAFFFAIVMTFVVGCASTTSKEGTGEYIKDVYEQMIVMVK